MKIIQQATYGQHDAQIHQREYLYRGFIQVEKNKPESSLV